MKSLIFGLSLMLSTAAFSDISKPTQLDDLIRGEMSALQTYDTVLTDITNEKEKAQLLSIRNDHKEAVATLKKFAANKPEVLNDVDTSGVWGSFAKTWTKGAKLIGNTTALKALTQGEEHGINEYVEALEDKTISADLKKVIKTKMLPAQRAHINTLKTFI